ncbi:MAG TPA: VWA domain-containing protein [Acidobacteriota bacterium]|nr:VWA domain-containing protein [Acidobacteriota bacterium]
MSFYRFADPYLLGLLALLPLMGLWYWRRVKRKGATLLYSDIGRLKRAARASSARRRHLLFALRMLSMALLIAAFARPQTGVSGEDILTEGIDIMLVLDFSSSMLAEDLQPNRSQAAKQVASQFVQGRRNDRVGLVVFAGLAYTQCPLTLDYGVLQDLLDEMEVGIIEDGTAIGMGLATAVKRLRDSEAESKVAILLTDGRNNRGEIDPLTAAQMAKAFGVKVYTVGAGTRGEAPYPVNDPIMGRQYRRIRVDIDEDTLRQVAETTGGRYFRATDRESLQQVYGEIDQLERTEIKVEQFTRYGELFHYPLAAGLLLLLLELALAQTRFRKIP